MSILSLAAFSFPHHQRPHHSLRLNSTGGIIALGLGVENWTTPRCLGNLKNLLRRAFSEPRAIANLDQKGKYRSRPLRQGLSELFDETSKLYGNFTPRGLSTRVAVTSTLVREHQSVVLANYNREDSWGKGRLSATVFLLSFSRLLTTGQTSTIQVCESTRLCL
jgi:hypothetical protein